MIRIAVAVAIVIAGAGIVSCSLSGLNAEQQARVNELLKQDADMTLKIQSLFKSAKAGTITMEEAFLAVSNVQIQIKKNLAELEKLKAEGASSGGLLGGVIGGLISLFGRSGLHAAKSIPGPIGVLANILAPFLLGGSGTATAKPAVTPTS